MSAEVTEASEGTVPDAAVQNQQPITRHKYTKTYMMTPCNHIYHTACLKKWIDMKLECPTCRAQIPALEED